MIAGQWLMVRCTQGGAQHAEHGTAHEHTRKSAIGVPRTDHYHFARYSSRSSMQIIQTYPTTSRCRRLSAVPAAAITGQRSGAAVSGRNCVLAADQTSCGSDHEMHTEHVQIPSRILSDSGRLLLPAASSAFCQLTTSAALRVHACLRSASLIRSRCSRCSSGVSLLNV